ncbi:MAG: hypothetical protein BJ554DRAFT_8016, partial [Olpidium bornovanus]
PLRFPATGSPQPAFRIPSPSPSPPRNPFPATRSPQPAGWSDMALAMQQLQVRGDDGCGRFFGGPRPPAAAENIEYSHAAHGDGNPRQRGNHAINVRQAKEDARREIVKQTEYYAATKQRVSLVSEFEEHTTAQTVRNAVRARFLELREAHDQTIEDRRSQLVELLSKDFATWREQLLANEETKEERLEHMRKRATELKARREAERKRIVEEKMYQRWRSGCDEIRAVESKALEREVAIGRLDQMREKQKSFIAAEEENRKWDEAWEAERQRKVKREEFERTQRIAVNAATTAALDEQLRLLREQAENEERLKKDEAKLMVRGRGGRAVRYPASRARRSSF